MYSELQDDGIEEGAGVGAIEQVTGAGSRRRHERRWLTHPFQRLPRRLCEPRVRLDRWHAALRLCALSPRLRDGASDTALAFALTRTLTLSPTLNSNPAPKP